MIVTYPNIMQYINVQIKKSQKNSFPSDMLSEIVLSTVRLYTHSPWLFEGNLSYIGLTPDLFGDFN